MDTSNPPADAPPRSRPLEVFHGHRALPRRLRGATIAVGNFDGVHRGHRHLFDEIRRRAAARSGESVVLTFDPHPARLLSPQYAPPLITSLARKLALIESTGVDVCVLEPFDAALAALSPVAFVDEVLVSALGAAEVCVGYDFTFGHKRAGDIHLLQRLGAERGFVVTIIDPVSVQGIVASSTKVRQFVLEGRVDGANLLLGRDFDVEGEVVRGAGRGRTIGVPTVNLRLDTELLPKGGVYAGWAIVPPDAHARGARPVRYGAAINVGTNPTFTAAPGSSAPPVLTVEAHLLDFPPRDLYGARLRLGFSARLRDEQRFASVDELVARILRDIDAARTIWSTRTTRSASAR